jgi:long-chain acyl-CoA synthetase
LDEAMGGTLGDFLRCKARAFGDRPALLYRPRYHTLIWSYRRLLDESGRVACWLQAHGVEPGQCVVLWAPNSPWWVAAFFGLLRRGAIVVPLDLRSSPDFVARVFKQTAPALALVGGPIAWPPDVNVRSLTLDDLVADLPLEMQPETVPITAESVAEIMFTSGTTGDPKGVILTHRNILASVDGVSRVLPSSPEYRLLSLLPLSHMFEQTVGLLLPLAYGASVFYPVSRQPSIIFRDLARQRVTLMLTVPQALQGFMAAIDREVERSGRGAGWRRAQHLAPHLPMAARRLLFRRLHRQLGGALSCLVSGGAALDPELERTWELVGIPVLTGYGATEAAPCIATTDLHHRKPGSVGKAVPGVELRVADDGEILVRGANVTPGYWHNDEATARAFLDGWYRTGDLGSIDRHGYLTLHGRKKNLIVLDDGQNVYPEDVEGVLTRAGATDAVVYGRPTARGLQVHAILLLGDAAPAAESIVAAANAQLAPHQRVRGHTVWSGADFPRTHTLKVKRDAVLQAIAVQGAPAETAERAGGDAVTKAPPAPASLLPLIAEVAHRPLGELDDDMSLGDIGLDSLGRVELLSVIEAERGVYIDEAVIGPETTAADLGRLVGSSATAPAERPRFPAWPRSWPARIARAALRPILFAGLGAVAPARVAGGEKLDGLRPPLLIVANHTSHLDTPTLLHALPPRLAGRVAVAAASDYFFSDRPRALAAGLLFNAFPFSRGGAIGGSIEHCSALIDRGWSILIFPEGTRSTTGEMAPFKEGIGLLAVELGVPILPARIDGLVRVLPKGRSLPRRGPVRVSFGPVLQFTTPVTYATAAARIEAAVRALG